MHACVCMHVVYPSNPYTSTHSHSQSWGPQSTKNAINLEWINENKSEKFDFDVNVPTEPLTAKKFEMHP